MQSSAQEPGGGPVRTTGYQSREPSPAPRTPVFHGNSGGGGGPRSGQAIFGGMPPDETFDINLTFEGYLVRQQVTTHMRVYLLADIAAAIYNLNAQELILMLFGMIPRTLTLQGKLSDPVVECVAALMTILQHAVLVTLTYTNFLFGNHGPNHLE
jgi:hypothetical protein